MVHYFSVEQIEKALKIKLKKQCPTVLNKLEAITFVALVAFLCVVKAISIGLMMRESDF